MSPGLLNTLAAFVGGWEAEFAGSVKINKLKVRVNLARSLALRAAYRGGVNAAAL